MTKPIETVYVTGGAGYVGAVLVPQLLRKGYRVRVLDLFLFGDNVLDEAKNHPKLEIFKGDLRDETLLQQSIPGSDAVIHLACVSNDPSFELNPSLSREINFDAFGPLVRISRDVGVRRFIYASTCSVYGVSDADDVTEDHPLMPITDYNKYKGLCEPILLENQAPSFTTVVVRPATVCGYSPRQRLDLTVNILTNLAWHNRRITVFGGTQYRPNIHIGDVVDLYTMLLELHDERIAGKIFNAGYENQPVQQLAETVKSVVGEDVKLITSPSDDNRSYHISSEKIKAELVFEATHSIRQAVEGLCTAFDKGLLHNSLDNE